VDAYCYTSLDFPLKCVSGGEIRRQALCGKSEFERTAISLLYFSQPFFSCFEETLKEKYRFMGGWKKDEEKTDLWSGIYWHEYVAGGMPYEA